MFIALKQSSHFNLLCPHQQSRATSLGWRFVVAHPQSVLLAPPNSVTANLYFTYAYKRLLVLQPRQRTSRPAHIFFRCMPSLSPRETSLPLPFLSFMTTQIQAKNVNLPHQIKRSASLLVNEAALGSLALRPAALPLRNLRP